MKLVPIGVRDVIWINPESVAYVECANGEGSHTLVHFIGGRTVEVDEDLPSVLTRIGVAEEYLDSC